VAYLPPFFRVRAHTFSLACISMLLVVSMVLSGARGAAFFAALHPSSLKVV